MIIHVQLIAQKSIARPQFSFKLALDTPSELFLGGMRQGDFLPNTTEWTPVSSKTYWVIPARATLGGEVVVGGIQAIIDTGTTVVVVRPLFFLAFSFASLLFVGAEEWR